MTASCCARESEVIDVALRGRWPAGADEELRVHVESCEACADTALVAASLRADYLLTRQDAPVPSAAHVWWRATLRARMDVAREAARPTTMAQGLAGAAAIGLLVALIGMVWPWLAAAFAWVAIVAGRLDPAAAQAGMMVLALVERSLPLVLAAALCMLIGPVAVYLALSDE
jgi:hypothetical protein